MSYSPRSTIHFQRWWD